MKPTTEQADGLRGVKENKKVRIIAAAGSGKTTFLTMCANENPEWSLYLTFNKNMAEEARNKFPPNVDVRTTHSIAFAYTGRDIAHKLTRPRGPYKNVCGTGSEIARHFRIAPYVLQGGRSISGTAMGYAVRSTLARFEQSADKMIGAKHVSFTEAEKELKNPYFSREEYAARILKYAEKLWKERINPESDIMATHDTYLKMFQLQNIGLDGYERIYLDESHDSNPCLLDIVLKQDLPTVMVGDRYQAIYQWRGAVDALEKVDWPTFYLTKSFRFGEEIASAARSVLTDIEGQILLPVKGNEMKDSKIVENIESPMYTKIFRTNAALISEGVEMIATGASIALNIDVRDFKNLVESVSALKDSVRNESAKKLVKHQDVIPYNSWKEFTEEMEVTGNAELKRVFKYVEEGIHKEMIEVLDNYIPPSVPNIIFTTAHRSKGLEYNNVILAEDFKYPEYDKGGQFLGWTDAERNLLYVALTRAKENLVLNDMVKEVHEDDWSNMQIGNASISHYLDYEGDLDKTVDAQVMTMSPPTSVDKFDLLNDMVKGEEKELWDDHGIDVHRPY